MAMLQKYQDRRPGGGTGVELLPQPGTKARDQVTMTIVRKEKKPGRHEEVVEKEVTFTENIRFEEFPQLNDSEEDPGSGRRGAPFAYAHATSEPA